MYTRSVDNVNPKKAAMVACMRKLLMKQGAFVRLDWLDNDFLW
ncbi:hypothetical protein MIDIC_460002 [Alphaproteobacteria bacterium]